MKFEIFPFKKVFEKEASDLYHEVSKTYLYSPENCEYESEYARQTYLDVGFTICLQDTPVLALAATVKENELSFFGRPVALFLAPKMSEEISLELMIFYFQKLDELIVNHNIEKMSYWDQPLMNNHFYESITGHDIWLNAMVDLEASEGTILRNIRKSYRSLINWGEREIKIVQVDKDNPDSELFEKFRLFHIEVAGKETRSKKSWDLQFELILKGQAFLNLGFLNNEMVAGAFVLLGESEAYYGVAVNDRKIMGLNKPLGHSTVYRSIMLAKKLGRNKFNLGPVFYPGMNEKEKHIGLFKKGFSESLESSLIIKVHFS